MVKFRKLLTNFQTANQTSVRVNREAFKLLRALGGNDTVKAHIVQQGAAPIIKQVLETHLVSALPHFVKL